MIVYNREENKEKIAEIIQLMGMDLEPMMAWELSDKGRSVHNVKLGEIKNDTDEFSFKGDGLSFSSNTIFFFNKEQRVIFKTELVSCEENVMSVKIPEVMKVLEESEQDKIDAMLKAFSLDTNNQGDEITPSVDSDGKIVDSFGFANNHDESDWLTKTLTEHDAKLLEEELSYITLEEEDQMFADQRATPRAKPPEGKMITVQLQNEQRPQSTYALYDLSQGGLSFLVFTQDEFSVGEKVEVKAFDTKKFERPIVSVVRAVREADQLGIQFKVGCEFIHYDSE